MKTCNFHIKRTPILLYDDGCAVCRRIAQWVREAAADGSRRPTINVRAIGSDPAALRSLRPELDIWDAYATIHLLMPDGTMRMGGEAVGETLQRLPKCKWFARSFSWRIFGFRPFQQILNIAYLVLADIRPLLGCESCGSTSKWVAFVSSFVGLFRRRSKKTNAAAHPHFTRALALPETAGFASGTEGAGRTP